MRIAAAAFIIASMLSSISAARADDAYWLDRGRQMAQAGVYDEKLCVTAQRLVVDGRREQFEITNDIAEGVVFTQGKAYVESDSGKVLTRTMIQTAERNGTTEETVVLCKVLTRNRLNDTLDLDLTAQGTCRQVNEHTHEIVLSTLTEEERNRYLNEGRPLVLWDDFLATAGAEWFPSDINNFITPAEATAERRGWVTVQSPSVFVPWKGEGSDTVAGTQLCKLISLAAMRRWMTEGAFDANAKLIPQSERICLPISGDDQANGSCIFYFGPPQRTFCQDYTGFKWTADTARIDCSRRHKTKAQWDAYAGQDATDSETSGGYSAQSCRQRGHVAEVKAAPYSLADAEDLGTCVLRCGDPDELQWQILQPNPPEVRMDITQICDLYVAPQDQSAAR